MTPCRKGSPGPEESLDASLFLMGRHRLYLAWSCSAWSCSVWSCSPRRVVHRVDRFYGDSIMRSVMQSVIKSWVFRHIEAISETRPTKQGFGCCRARHNPPGRARLLVAAEAQRVPGDPRPRPERRPRAGRQHPRPRRDLAHPVRTNQVALPFHPQGRVQRLRRHFFRHFVCARRPQTCVCMTRAAPCAIILGTPEENDS